MIDSKSSNELLIMPKAKETSSALCIPSTSVQFYKCHKTFRAIEFMYYFQLLKWCQKTQNY